MVAHRGPRIYPRSRAAALVVWLLDRLPKRVRDDVLGTYWSPTDLDAVYNRASDLDEFFGKDTGNGS